MVVRYNIQFASLALLYYDYFLTWAREVKYFWRKKISLSTLLYICCRYSLLANVIYIFALGRKINFMSCDSAYQLCCALSLFGRFGIMMVWGARTYAVFERNKYILALLLSLGFFVIVIAIIHIPFVSCSGKKIAFGIPPQLLAIATTLFEVVAAVLTTARLCVKSRTIEGCGIKRKSLSAELLEQGILYIVFVSLFSVTTIVLFNIKATKGTFFELLLNALTIPISGLMTCRFLLHLREWEGTNTGYSSTHKSVQSRQIEFQLNLSALEDLDDSDSESILTVSDGSREDPLFNVPFRENQEWTEIQEPVGAERV